MQQYPLWKTLTLVIVTLIGALYALPNLYGMSPSVQIASASGDAVPADLGAEVAKVLDADKIPSDSSRAEKGQWIVRFSNPDAQLKAVDALKQELGQGYVVSLNLASRTPAWLEAIGARPMPLGLDLQGGVHLLLQVDIDDARKAAVQRYLSDLPAFLRKKDIRYTARRADGDTAVLEFADTDKLEKARAAIAADYKELDLSVPAGAPTPTLRARMSDTEAKRIVDYAVQQNLITLRNRVNRLGVSEPIVQRQGADRILIQLPGVQDPARVKEMLGATATLEYRAVDETPGAAQQAAATGIVPPDDELFYRRDNKQPVLLKRDVIASGPQITDVAPMVDQQSGTPAVSVTLDSAGGAKMFEFTRNNVNKPMAVLYKETIIETNYNAQGEAIRERRDVNDVISVANIREPFGRRFQTTGLSQKEAHDLSELLKAGALAAPIEIVEERTVGPSEGADNIRAGAKAAVAGFCLVVVFMAVYYTVFGLFADIALFLNLVILVAVLSIFQATLTMAGIAGIVLTLGMAVDANVLINERIREELRLGLSPHAAMSAGYERAFLTIADSNVTTFIAAAVLFLLGQGTIKGFAVTLMIGLATSMFTAIVGTRTIAYYALRGRKLKDLPV
ncbi:MAG TPA: protein translocase subunit SecD [Nevskia sp.]|jgi:preprotein translocase subunit SecD|nr:protein translocase subunit SecD [Nevskia sp.]